MKTKAQDAAVAGSASQEPRKHGKARRPKVVPHTERQCFKGRRVYTENDRKEMACPYPPEPEWVALLEAAADRREKGGGT